MIEICLQTKKTNGAPERIRCLQAQNAVNKGVFSPARSDSVARFGSFATLGKPADNTVEQAHEFRLTGVSRRRWGAVDGGGDGQDPARSDRGRDPGHGFYPAAGRGRPSFRVVLQAIYGAPLNPGQAGDYLAVAHYLCAIEEIGTDAAATVIEQMTAIPVHDAFAPDGAVRGDRRMGHDIYLTEVKTPSGR